MRDRGFDARAVVASLVVHLLLAWPLLNPPPSGRSRAPSSKT